MLTINQLKTFYWVGRLGTLAKAADMLHITQSTATKRLQELAQISDGALFEKSSRKNFLTARGKELMLECEKMFELLEQLEATKKSNRQPARTLYMGLSEVTALTWFPSFLRKMKDVYPTVTVQPEIDQSETLRRKVEDGRLDFAIIPEAKEQDGLEKVLVGKVEFDWYAAPGMFDEDIAYSLPQLADKPVVEQSEHSIITILCSQLWESAGVRPERIYGGNNIVALAGLISAGVGVSCLPTPLFIGDVEKGKLQRVKTTAPIPHVGYYFCFLKHPHSALGYNIASIAQQTCSFAR